MIIEEELLASIDEPTACVCMHRVQPSKLQMAALQLADKLNSLADHNDSILDPRNGLCL
jgi:translation initiation factor 3 subunit C